MPIDLHAVTTTAAICATCGDGCGWMRWCFEGTWRWASCADCNETGDKRKPHLCPVCAMTLPFCSCPVGRVC